jgi:hypothetical protein|tara:strand:+ start:26 stop:256 length:231 start_codon:yes stop_codon:yes gene_type:complete
MIEGLYTKENLWAEFATQKTKPKKIKWLKEMRDLRETQPKMFAGTSISVKNFENLIAEWSKRVPFAIKKTDEGESL